MKSMISCVGGELHKEMQLSLEPVRMVNMKRVAAACEEMSSTNPAAGAPGGGVRQACALQIYELSNLDQIFAHYNSVALFYDVLHQSSETCTDHDRNGAGNVDGLVKRLQGALEELLVHYPAAAGRFSHCLNDTDQPGRLQIEYYIHSSAQSGDHILHGVPFVVAHANIALCELGDVSRPHPSLDLLHPTLPKTGQDSSGKYLPRPVMAMQVTTFTCGGFCLAHTCSHTFMDGHAAATFLQNMCSIARGAGLTVLPDVLSSRGEIMKPRMPPSPSLTASSLVCVGTRKPGEVNQQLFYSSATRFAFRTAALEALREKASSSASAGQAQAPKPCSRYQALAALLWTAQAKSLMARRSTPRPPGSQEFNLVLPMSLREKGIPGLTRGYTGNAILPLTVRSTLQELCESSLPSVVRKIKSVLEAGSDNLSECAQSQIDYVELQLREGVVPIFLDHTCVAMPSFVNLPFYDTDCGWGRPVYCGCPSRQLGQRFIILDHPAAGAWNVLAVFNSLEEHAAFQQEIAEYINS